MKMAAVQCCAVTLTLTLTLTLTNVPVVPHESDDFSIKHRRKADGFVVATGHDESGPRGHRCRQASRGAGGRAERGKNVRSSSPEKVRKSSTVRMTHRKDASAVRLQFFLLQIAPHYKSCGTQNRFHLFQVPVLD